MISYIIGSDTNLYSAKFLFLLAEHLDGNGQNVQDPPTILVQVDTYCGR